MTYLTPQAQVAAKLRATGATSIDLARELRFSQDELSDWLQGNGSELTPVMESVLWEWLFADDLELASA